MADNSRHARIPEYVIRHSDDLKPRELRVLLCLLLHRNGRTGRCNPARKTIGEFLGLHRSHLSIAIAGLQSKGWVLETPDGFFFAPEVVTNLATADDGDLLPIQQPNVSSLARNVTKSATRLNIIKQNKQDIKQLSIDAIADKYEKEYPGTDRRIVEVGILFTMSQRTDPNERISSLAYFRPEIEKREREILHGDKDGNNKLGTGPQLDEFLEYMRGNYDRYREQFANAA